MVTCGECIMGYDTGLEIVCSKLSYVEKNKFGEEVTHISYHSPYDGCKDGTLLQRQEEK